MWRPNQAGSAFACVELHRATEYVRRFSDLDPRVGLVLGTGFSNLTWEVQNEVVLDFSEIPHFPALSVPGHRGQLTLGTLQNVPVVISSGRKHLYEGEGLLPVLFPVLFFRSLGARTLILTNAAGGAHAEWEVGDIMLIRDHIDSTFHAFTAPTREIAAASGLPVSLDPPTCPYTPHLCELARHVAERNRIILREGVYVFSLGPFFETKAEVEALARLGGDAFGMSTAPEALAAAALGMDVLALSVISNYATGIATRSHDHGKVTRNAERAMPRVSALICGILESLAQNRNTEGG